MKNIYASLVQRVQEQGAFSIPFPLRGQAERARWRFYNWRSALLGQKAEEASTVQVRILANPEEEGYLLSFSIPADPITSTIRAALDKGDSSL